jgi:hypothetical protein
MRSTDCSQHEVVPCSRPSFRPLSVGFHTEFSPAPWNDSRTSCEDVSNRIGNAGYTGSDEDVKAVSQLMDEIRAAIADCQVSSKVRTGSAI